MDKIRMVFLFMPEGIWRGLCTGGLEVDYKQGDVKEWNKIEERDFTRFFLAGGLR